MGHAFVSPLRRWDVIVGLCQSINAQTFVEVGCKEGRTTGFVLANCPDIRVIAIDPWVPQPKGDDPAQETYEDWDFAEIERKFWQNVGERKDRCTMMRVTSEVAASRFSWDTDWNWMNIDLTTEDTRGSLLDLPATLELDSIDLVFLDALHDYASVKQDIELWWPKVRDGGFICGHDFNHKWPGVMRAVADSFPLMRVGVCPDSMWFVQKDPAVRLAA